MRQDTASRKITVTTLIICIISIFFTLTSIFSISNMQKAASRIYQHPYTVSNSSREMRSRLLDMKQFISIFLTDSFHSAEETEALLEKRYAMQQESIDVITENYLGPKEDTARLQEKMNALIAAQAEALTFVSNHTDQEISAYLDEKIYPRYDDVSEALTTIIAFANNKIITLEKEMESTGTISIAVAILLSGFIIVLTVITNRQMEHKRRRDIADREKMFDLLSFNVDDVFFIYNLKSQLLEYISPNSERILGLNEEELKQYDPFYAMLDEESKAALYQLFHSGVLHSQAELSFKLKRSGQADNRWMLLKAYPVENNGKINRYIISISDQTGPLLVQQNLRDALTSAQQANEAKKDFLSRMSHEIRTPMNAIIGMVTIAAANIQDRSRVEDCLTKIGLDRKSVV